MSDKEKAGAVPAVREVATTITNGCERRAADLLRAVTELSALLEFPMETPRKDGGQPLRRVSAVWEDAVEWVTNAQQAAAACFDDVFALITEIEYYAECLDEYREKLQK